MATQMNLADHTFREILIERLGDPTEYRIEREDHVKLDLRDMKFRGWKLGEGEDGSGGNGVHEWTRGVVATVYITEGGNLITAIRRWSRLTDERDLAFADSHSDVDYAYEWFMVQLWGAKPEPKEYEDTWSESEDEVRSERRSRAGDDQYRATTVAIKHAWTQACLTHPALAEADIEVIE